MKLKGYLASAFLVTAGIGFNMTWLALDNAEARNLVTQSGGTITSSSTGILWGQRYGAPAYASGTYYTAKDEKGHEVEGVIHKPLLGNPVIKCQAPR
jgi:hypothetical protein